MKKYKCKCGKMLPENIADSCHSVSQVINVKSTSLDENLMKIIYEGWGCDITPYNEEEAVEKIKSLFREEMRESLRLNIGLLRQWLNEDRIKDADRFVTNEDIEMWLGIRDRIDKI